MVILLSYFISIVITVVLATILYPISAIFFIIGKVGHVLGKLADYIFSHANSTIAKLWSDIKHTKVVRENDTMDAKADDNFIFSEENINQ